MNKSKCEFLRTELEFLGHHISRDGIHPQQKKIQGIQEIPVPTNVKEVRAFLGATGYYRRFYSHYSQTAKPLFHLTRKNATFEWTEAHQQAFQELKNQLLKPPVLVHPDYDKPFTLWVDASNTGVGGVLTQIDAEGFYKPIHFFSQKLTDGQQKWSTYEREMFAALRGVTIMRPMIYGRELEIRTDHAPLVHHDPVNMVNPKMQCWAATLSQYGARLVHVKDKHNTIADFMSRIAEPEARLKASEIDGNRPETDPELDIDPNPEPGLRLDKIVSEAEIIQAQHQDPHCRRIQTELTSPNCLPNITLHYTYVNRLLHHVDRNNCVRLVVPQDLQEQILAEAHEGAHGGHFSVKRTYNSLKQYLFWPGQYTDVVEWVDQCVACNQANLRARQVPIEDIPVPKMPLEKVHIDVYGPLNLTEAGNQYILTCIDALTGWVEFKASPTKSAKDMAQFLTDQIILRHGTPRMMVTDNGTENINQIMKHILTQLRIKHIRTSTYNPRSNGRIERTH